MTDAEITFRLDLTSFFLAVSIRASVEHEALTFFFGPGDR